MFSSEMCYLCLNGSLAPTSLFSQVHRCVTKSDPLQQITVVMWIEMVISDILRLSQGTLTQHVLCLVQKYNNISVYIIYVQCGPNGHIGYFTKTHKHTYLSFLCLFFVYLFFREQLHNRHWLYICAAAGLDALHLTMPIKGMYHQLLLIQLNANNFTSVFYSYSNRVVWSKIMRLIDSHQDKSENHHWVGQIKIKSI